MSDDDRRLLDALMTAAGVRPLDRGTGGGKAKAARPPRPASPAPAGSGAASPGAAGPGTQAGRTGQASASPSADRPAPPSAAPPLGAPGRGPGTPAARQAERDATPAARAAESTALAGRLAQAEAARDALHAERDALAARLAEVEAAHHAADHERRALARKIAALREQPAGPTAGAPLAEVLAQRGLLPAEHAPALAALLAALPQPTLEALAAPETLPALLDQHLVLLCPAEACQRLSQGSASLPVAPDRCEVCGGSDTASAWRHLVAACAARGVQRLVIVGGSPTYRRQLRELAGDGPLRLDLVDGRAQPAARKVKSMARTADLVVIWCATILDHATTNAFVAAGVQPLQVPHRGIGRMLGWLAAAIEGLPRS